MGRASTANMWMNGANLEKVCEWVSNGLSDKQLARNMGISESTFYNWKRDNPSFAAALSEAKEKPKIELENSMYKLATGQMYIEEVKTTLDPQGQRVTKIDKVRKQLPPNPQIQMFLAKAWMPEKYKEERSDDIEVMLNG